MQTGRQTDRDTQTGRDTQTHTDTNRRTKARTHNDKAQTGRQL